MSTKELIQPLLNRRAAVARILRERGDALAIASLGNPTFDVAAAGDCPQNFYLWGAMGGAVMVGLGLALAQPKRRVVVFVGDGEMMMGLGSLATAAVQGAENLCVLVIDNEHYAETGMQATHTGRGVDISGVAKAVGFPETRIVRGESELQSAIELIFHGKGPVLVSLKVSTEPVSTILPPRDGPFLRSRFREALLGADAHR
jgi:thiamine pyrophosphate-dependent acetolactate synthase large subunit-like protein